MIKLDFELRKRVNAELQPDAPVSEREWEMLDSQRILDQLRCGNLFPAGVAEKIKQLRDVYLLSPPPTKDRGGEVTSTRMRAMSELVAQDVRKDDAVLAFRKDVLGGRLLAKEKIAEWIYQKAELEGPSTVFLIVPLPPGVAVNLQRTGGELAIVPSKPINISKDWPAVATDIDMVSFPVEGKPARSMPVRTGGILDRLRVLSETLAERYGWLSSESTTFILADVPPVSTPLSARYEKKDISALSRIVLTIDPALSPREVSERYRDVRRQYFAGRHRSMSEKHHTLVLFMNSRPVEETYAGGMTAWNRKYPNWKYTSETNFGRDVQVARRRLLGLKP